MNNDNMELMEQIKAKSIGKDKKDILKTSIREMSKKAAAGIAALLMVVTLASCKKDGIDYMALRNYMPTYTQLASSTLIYYHLDCFDYDTKEYIKHSVEDYKRIESLNEINLIGYYRLLGYEECEKVVQALGYEGWDDFLTKKNCFDKEGKPSIEEWERQTEEYIYYHDIVGEKKDESRSRSN